MTTAKSSSTQLGVARESSWGVAPSSGYVQLPPNSANGLQGWEPQYVDVNRDVLSPYMTDEKGDHVGRSASPSLVSDLNKDYADIFFEGWTRSLAKVPGDEPTTAIYRPTAFADGGGSADSLTVAADGDLADDRLVIVRGAVNAANNGVFVTSGTSTTVAIKVATGTFVAETVSPTGSVTAELCGVQGASADITMNASGHLTSTLLDFTTLGLQVGHRIRIGGDLAAHQFATAAINGWATVALAPTANHITLKWWNFTPAADSGTGKTIRLHFGRLYRNVYDGHADYVEPSWHGELQVNGVGTAGVATYEYGQGLGIGSVSLSMPLKGKIEVTTSFVGKDLTDPVLAASRVAGPSTAFVPLATDLIDTSNDLIELRVLNAATEAELIASVLSCTLMIDHGVTPREQLASETATGLIYGKIRPRVSSMEVYYEDDAVPTAIRANTTCRFEAIMRNGQCGIAIDLPGVRLTGGKRTFADNQPVKMGLELPAHRDPLTNIVMLLNVLPYVPAT